MAPIVWFYLILSLIAETVGDIALKANYLWISLLSYNLMLFMWFRVVKHAGNMLMLPGTIWLLGGEIILILLGIFVFHEPINTKQCIGLALGGLAILMMN